MIPTIDVEKVFVAHVKSGYESRRRSIVEQLSRLNLCFEFMLDGDIEDITEELKDRWFLPELINNPKMMSCTCKHFLIYEQIVKSGWQGALILEDDIFLAVDFVEEFNKSMRELFSRRDVFPSRAWVSYENSTLRFPSRTILKSTQRLYRSGEPRCTGAYYIGAEAAHSLLKIADTEKVDLPIDCYVALVTKRNKSPLELYWCHPTIAEQGSMNGVFSSMDIRRKAGLWRKMKWRLDKYYKVLKHRVA